MNLKALGKSGAKFEGLETFPTPPGVTRVTCISDEVTAVCPITGQPDWYVVEVTYRPDKVCVESKTVKLFLQSYRNEGHFCEAFASIVAHEFQKALLAHGVHVKITQKARGGVSIVAEAVVGGKPI